jgi:DNA-binding NarL/FixJ family response regulator
MATRILIADDHEMIRTVLRNLINSHTGWQVCAEASNGSEAVAQAKKVHPDVIVLDLAMPVMDGMTAAREIRRNSPDAQMIMFTLHASPEVEEHAKRAGVAKVVSKARNSARLVTAIEQVVGSGSPDQDAGSADDLPTAEFAREGSGNPKEIQVHQAGTETKPTNNRIDRADIGCSVESGVDADAISEGSAIRIERGSEVKARQRRS